MRHQEMRMAELSATFPAMELEQVTEEIIPIRAGMVDRRQLAAELLARRGGGVALEEMAETSLFHREQKALEVKMVLSSLLIQEGLRFRREFLFSLQHARPPE